VEMAAPMPREPPVTRATRDMIFSYINNNYEM
jgi:hypothetical protein